MRNSVMSILGISPVLAPLEEHELRQVAAASRRREAAAGEILFAHGQQDTRFYVLQRGRVVVHLKFMSGKRCKGETSIVLSRRGQTLGWSALIRGDRISASARCLEDSSFVAVDLRRLAPGELALKVYRRLVQQLYGLLQEAGLCPPNPRALLAFGAPM